MAKRKVKKPTTLSSKSIEGFLRVQPMSHDDNLLLLTFCENNDLSSKMFSISLSKDELRDFKKSVDIQETANCEMCHAFVGYLSFNEMLLKIANGIGDKEETKAVKKLKRKVRRRRLAND